MDNRTLPHGALYYPYIHIRDVNWLKANLLMFPHMERMIPNHFDPYDDTEIKPFTRYKTANGPLLRAADLYSDSVSAAQKRLATKLRRDADNDLFVLKYGQAATQRLKAPGDLGFQIHAAKMVGKLVSALAEGGLGWKPGLAEPYDFQEKYIEVHPSVGQAVMATLAIACAQDNGLDIVGDGRSGPLHQCLLERALDQVYDTWLSVEEQPLTAPAPVTGESLFEYIIGIPKDRSGLSALTPEIIYELSEERAQINRLMKKLREKASAIRPAGNPSVKEQAFQDVSSDILKEWDADRNNFGNYGRAFFGQDTTKMATDFAKTVADKTLTGVVSGATVKATTVAATGAATSAGWLGTLATGGLIGAGAGLVVGLLVHAGTTYRKQVKREKESPYRFLTSLEDAGVVFRSGI